MYGLDTTIHYVVFVVDYVCDKSDNTLRVYSELAVHLTNGEQILSISDGSS